MSRKKARENLMKFLYQIECIPANDGDLEIFLDNFVINADERDFIINSYYCIVKNLQYIDETIQNSLLDWTINRLNKVDLSVLRIATYEMMFCEDIPKKVSINEAVEIAKTYSTSESSVFINGVLADIFRKLQLETEGM